jgi:hypothetical protein
MQGSALPSLAEDSFSVDARGLGAPHPERTPGLAPPLPAQPPAAPGGAIPQAPLLKRYPAGRTQSALNWERLAEDQMEFAAAKIRWHNVASPDSKAKARAQEDIAIDKARKFAVRALKEEGNDEEDVKQAAEASFKKKVHEAEAAARQQVKQAKAAAQAQLKAENEAANEDAEAFAATIRKKAARLARQQQQLVSASQQSGASPSSASVGDQLVAAQALVSTSNNKMRDAVALAHGKPQGAFLQGFADDVSSAEQLEEELRDEARRVDAQFSKLAPEVNQQPAAAGAPAVPQATPTDQAKSSENSGGADSGDKQAAVAKLLETAASELSPVPLGLIEVPASSTSPSENPESRQGAAPPETSLYDPNLMMPLEDLSDDSLAEMATMSAGVGASTGLYMFVADLWRSELSNHGGRALPQITDLSCDACKMVLQRGCSEHGNFPACASDDAVRKVIKGCTSKGLLVASGSQKSSKPFSCPEAAGVSRGQVQSRSRSEIMAAWHELNTQDKH